MNEVALLISDGPRDLPACRDAAYDAARKMGFAGDDLGDVVSAVFEACVNAITHGRGDPERLATLTIRTLPDRFEATVQDFGCGYDCPKDTPLPPLAAPRGRGVPLMRKFMDEVRFESDDGCKVTLVKRLPSEG